MKKVLLFSTTVFFVSLLIAGCSGKLYVAEMTANPSPASAGDEVVSYIKLNKASDNIKTVKGTVREYPQVTVKYRNDGQGADEKAGDNIWSKKTTVPYNAPPQEFHLDITIIDEEGQIIATKEAKGEKVEKSGTISLVIE
jgi:hypothetical protein